MIPFTVQSRSLTAASLGRRLHNFLIYVQWKIFSILKIASRDCSRWFILLGVEMTHPAIQWPTLNFNLNTVVERIRSENGSYSDVKVKKEKLKQTFLARRLTLSCHGSDIRRRWSEDGEKNKSRKWFQTPNARGEEKAKRKIKSISLHFIAFECFCSFIPLRCVRLGFAFEKTLFMCCFSLCYFGKHRKRLSSLDAWPSLFSKRLIVVGWSCVSLQFKVADLILSAACALRNCYKGRFVIPAKAKNFSFVLLRSLDPINTLVFPLCK